MIDGEVVGDLPFYREYPTAFSQVATDWLAWVESVERVAIQHARSGGEYRVTPKIAVDGYCKDTNTIYQVLPLFSHHLTQSISYSNVFSQHQPNLLFINSFTAANGMAVYNVIKVWIVL